MDKEGNMSKSDMLHLLGGIAFGVFVMMVMIVVVILENST